MIESQAWFCDIPTC